MPTREITLEEANARASSGVREISSADADARMPREGDTASAGGTPFVFERGDWRRAGPTRERAAALPPPTSGRLRDYLRGAAEKFYDAFDVGPKPEDFERAGLRPVKVRDPIRESIERISEARPENPTRAYAAGGGTGSAIAALPYTVATGGTSLPLTVAQIAGGAGGALASEEVRRHEGGPAAQFIAGLAGDIATGGLVRGATHLGGLAAHAMSPTARAGKYVGALDLADEGAIDAASAMRAEYGNAMQQVDDAYDAYRALPSTGTVDSSSLIEVARRQAIENSFSPEDLPDVAKRIPALVGDEVGVEDIERIRRGASSGMASPVSNTRRMAGEVMEAAESALDDIAAQSELDSSAAKALREAIASRRALGKKFPSASEVYELFISPKNISDEKAAEAFRKVLTSSDRDDQVRLIWNAAKGTPSTARAVKKALALAVLNAPEEVASGSPTSQLRTLDKAATVLREVWGDAGFKHFRRLLSEQATANRVRPFLIRGLLGKNTKAIGIGAGGLLGSAVGGPAETAAGMVLGGAFDELSTRLSQRTVRDVAVKSLFDPDLYRQVTRTPPAVGKAEWLSLLVGSLVRRGVISAEDAAATTGEATTTRTQGRQQ